VTTRAATIIRDLQNSKQLLISEDVQKLLLVCQNLRQNVIDEKDKIEQMKSEVNQGYARVQHAIKLSNQDQEAIQLQKLEIGNVIVVESCLICTISSFVLRSSVEKCGCSFNAGTNSARRDECTARKIGKTSKGSGKVFGSWWRCF